MSRDTALQVHDYYTPHTTLQGHDYYTPHTTLQGHDYYTPHTTLQGHDYYTPYTTLQGHDYYTPHTTLQGHDYYTPHTTLQGHDYYTPYSTLQGHDYYTPHTTLQGHDYYTPHTTLQGHDYYTPYSTLQGHDYYTHTLHYRLSGQTQAQDSRCASRVVGSVPRLHATPYGVFINVGSFVLGVNCYLTHTGFTLLVMYCTRKCVTVILEIKRGCFVTLLVLDLRCWSCTVHTDVSLLYWR